MPDGRPNNQAGISSPYANKTAFFGDSEQLGPASLVGSYKQKNTDPLADPQRSPQCSSRLAAQAPSSPPSSPWPLQGQSGRSRTRNRAPQFPERPPELGQALPPLP